MKNLRKYWFLFPIFVICLILFLSPYLFLSIQLNGDKKVVLEYGTSYEELGAQGKFFGTPLSVSIKGKVDSKKLGKQEVLYEVQNQLGIIRKKKRIINVVDETPPIITLNGGDTVTISLGEEYRDLGYTMIDNYDGDISKKVVLNHHIDVQKEGTYEVLYKGIDSSGNEAVQKRTVLVSSKARYKKEYDMIDNKVNGWWTGNKKDGIRPEVGAGSTSEDLKKYQAYYLGKDEKIVYLTFDEGSNDTYLKEIVEVLNQNDVKATFFLCKNFIRDNPEVIRKLVERGHSVGNHTHNHETMANYANEKDFETYLKEIKEVEEVFLEVTGKPIDRVYREPRGEWSYRSLQIMKDLGYKSYFWSAAYNDFSGDVSKEVALTKLIQQKHNGAIYLIHPTNKGNYEAMDHFIKEMKRQNYSFGLVRDIS